MSAIEKVKNVKDSIKDKSIKPVEIVKTGLAVVGGIAVVGGVAYLISKNVHIEKAVNILDTASDVVEPVVETVTEAAL